jgi:hypothetical protein
VPEEQKGRSVNLIPAFDFPPLTSHLCDHEGSVRFHRKPWREYSTKMRGHGPGSLFPVRVVLVNLVEWKPSIRMLFRVSSLSSTFPWSSRFAFVSCEPCGRLQRKRGDEPTQRAVGPRDRRTLDRKPGRLSPRKSCLACQQLVLSLCLGGGDDC